MTTEREEGEIYSDLTDVDLGAEISKLREKEQALVKHVHKLQKDIEKLCGKVTELYGDRESLSTNISELFKTARLEISRKDRRIEELQKELDDVVFRRNFTRTKRIRDDGNQELNEAKRAKEDAVPRNVEENCNRFNRNKNSYQWNNAQNQGRIKEETASAGVEYGSSRSNIPQNWKNLHNQDRNERRNSPILEIGTEREKEIVSKNVGDEGNCGRFKRNNSPYNRRYQNQGRNEGRIKEEGSYFGGNIEDNSNRYNRSKTYRNWKNFRNQGRNSPGMEVEARRIKEETSTHRNVDSEEDYSVEDNSSRYNRNNTSHPWKNIYNQGRNSPNVEVEAGRIKEETSAHKHVESEENCNPEDNSGRYNRNNSTHPWKNIHNQGTNSPNFEVEAKKMKEETSTHTSVGDEQGCSRFKRNNSPHRWKNTQYQDRNSPDMCKDRQQGREFRKDIKEDRNRHQEDDRQRREEFQQKEKMEKFREDSNQEHKQSESSRSNRDEKQRKHDDRCERRSSRDRHDRKHRSNSKDRHRSKNDRKNEERKERKLSERDDKDLEVSNAEKLKYNEPDTAGSNVVNIDHCSDKLEAYHEKHNETAAKIKSNHNALDSIQNKIECSETLQEKTKKLDKMVDYHREINQETLNFPEEVKQKTNSSITESMDILRADLNISNDSTGLPANTSDVGINNAISSSSNINEYVDKNLSASFNSSNVSDDLTKKVTPTFRRRRCVMSFKN